MPSFPNEWHKIAAKFENRWNYSHALGAIDGKYAIIKKPANCGSYHVITIRKNTFNHLNGDRLPILRIECLWADVDCNDRNSDGGYGICLDYTKVSKMERLSSLSFIHSFIHSFINCRLEKLNGESYKYTS